jgi:GTP-binding protein
MKFVDSVIISVKGGDGGMGISHFKREKFSPLGGPDGGDGGFGGRVLFSGTHSLSTLLDFRYKSSFEAESGAPGGTSLKSGRKGEDLIVSVPCGTEFYDSETREFLGEITEPGQQLVLARGGIGGKGNHRFVNAQNQAPTFTLPARPGEQRKLLLELKLIADVGIIGYPNAGKSSLVRKISNARPKVADYPFTTLVPNLGVVAHKDAAPFVVADIPGLIPGASEGKGLGLTFLKHIERTKVLVHMVDIQSSAEEYWSFLKEVENYSADLLNRKRVVVFSKTDTEDQHPSLEALAETIKEQGFPVYFLSSLTGQGIEPFLDGLLKDL